MSYARYYVGMGNKIQANNVMILMQFRGMGAP